ncbi:hypothetical protein [Candidatus Ichthyocystis hellenicum]|uniref:hypothetical protein n=1 Tax=Candidatus Ichthyocystis hellenicum TaxID=1561003 RepID=UPI00111224F3|nr:hypothetical protein [Candidatus Ichthyocystis hellenicum]
MLKARTSKNIDGLFIALQEGNADSVTAFGSLLDKFINMKGYIEDVPLVDMVFDLLMCKSGDNNVPGLFMAMQEGHYGAVGSFSKLLEKVVTFRDIAFVFGEYFDNMFLDTVISRRSDGISGLFVALRNNLPEVVTSYGLLLNLIPKDELVVGVLVASYGDIPPAVLFAGKEAFDGYFKIISNLPTKIIYDLYSRFNNIRMSIERVLSGNGNLDEKYRFLLEKIKELATVPRP